MEVMVLLLEQLGKHYWGKIQRHVEASHFSGELDHQRIACL